MLDDILAIINIIRENKSKALLKEITPETHLRDEIGFDSLDLAEFTVRIEERYGVDIFEDGIVSTIGEVMAKIRKTGG